MEEVFETTERAALPKRVVNSDFAYDELLGRRFRQPLSPPLRTSDFWHTHVSMRTFASQQMKIKNAACT